MVKTLLLIVLTLALQACVTSSKEMGNSPDAPEEIQALLWVKKADAEADARGAIRAGDYRVLVPAGRGVGVPGFDVEDGVRIRRACGEKILPGSTDVVRGDRHLALLQAAYRYAETYNRLVAKRCDGN